MWILFSGWFYAGAYHMRLEIFSEDFLQIQPIDIFQSKQVLVYAKNICCFEEYCHLKKESHIKKFKAKGQDQN